MSTANTERGRVLIVDDSGTVRSQIGAMLKTDYPHLEA